MTYFAIMDFDGDPNLGLYGFATDSYCVSGVSNRKLSALRVPVYVIKVLNIDMAGLFIAGNSKGIVISSVVDEYDGRRLRQYFSNILVLDTKYTALGNMFLMNDSGIIISPLLKRNRKEIGEFFGLPCETTTIARQKLVGSLGISTNRGCLTHPKIKMNEREKIEKTLGVPLEIGTVNFGSPYLGAGLIANSNGFVASKNTSGPELGRITEALGFL